MATKKVLRAFVPAAIYGTQFPASVSREVTFEEAMIEIVLALASEYQIVEADYQPHISREDRTDYSVNIFHDDGGSSTQFSFTSITKD